MTSGQAESEDYQVPAEAYEQLAAEPAVRSEIVVRLIEMHPRGQLALPTHGDRAAMLEGVDLQGLDLSVCDIAGVHVSGAWMEKAHFSQAQLAGAIGEERDRDYGEARKGYLALERVFHDLGDYDAASGAYRRRRRGTPGHWLDRTARLCRREPHPTLTVPCRIRSGQESLAS